MSLQKLKRSRNELQAKLQNAFVASEQRGYEDDRIWRPTLDKQEETGYARVRFLPPPDGEELPFVKVVNNAIKSATGKWYIEPSRRTINEPDPFNEFVSRIYNSGDKKDVNLYKNTHEGKAKKDFYANVLILEDPANRENEGKVKIFKFGQKIMEKIELKNKPKFKDEVAANPFDMWDGCDFIIKARKSDGQWTYEASTWSEPKALFDGDDDKLEEVYSKTHKLSEFLDPSKFKSYEELAKRLLDTMGTEFGSGIPVVVGGADYIKPAQEFTQTRKPSTKAKESEVNTPDPELSKQLKDDEDALDNLGADKPDKKEEASAPKVMSEVQTDDDFFSEFDD